MLHLVVVALELSDLIALLLFALPIAAYLSYCTHEAQAQMIKSAVQIYIAFAAVVLAAVGLVYVIG